MDRLSFKEFTSRYGYVVEDFPDYENESISVLKHEAYQMTSPAMNGDMLGKFGMTATNRETFGNYAPIDMTECLTYMMYDIQKKMLDVCDIPYSNSANKETLRNNLDETFGKYYDRLIAKDGLTENEQEQHFLFYKDNTDWKEFWDVYKELHSVMQEHPKSMAHRMQFFREGFINDIENTKDNNIREGEVTMANEQTDKISLDRFAKLSNCQVYNNGTNDKPDFKFYDMDGNENIIIDIGDVATGLVCSNRDDLNQIFKIEENNCDKLKGLYNAINKPNIQPYLQDPDKYPGVLDSIENLSGYPQGSITLMNNLCKDDAFKEKLEITLQVDELLNSPKQEALQKLNDYFEIDVLTENKKVDMSFMKDILDKPENQLFDYNADGIEAAMEYINLQAQYDDAIYTSAKYVQDMPLEFEQTVKTDMSMLQNENNKLRDDLLFQSINKESVDKTMNLLQDRILENNAKLLALELARRVEAIEKLQNVSPDNRSLFKIISDDVKRDVKNGIDFAKNAIETTSNAIHNGVDKVNNVVKEGINQIKNFAKECIDKGLKAVGEKVQQIQNVVDNVKTSCANAVKTVKETVKGLPDKVKAFAGKLKDKAMEAKETVKQAYAEHLKEKRENIDKKLEKMGYDKN